MKQCLQIDPSRDNNPLVIWIDPPLFGCLALEPIRANYGFGGKVSPPPLLLLVLSFRSDVSVGPRGDGGAAGES